jgi:hypothetical protein
MPVGVAAKMSRKQTFSSLACRAAWQKISAGAVDRSSRVDADRLTRGRTARTPRWRKGTENRIPPPERHHHGRPCGARRASTSSTRRRPSASPNGEAPRAYPCQIRPHVLPHRRLDLDSVLLRILSLFGLLIISRGDFPSRFRSSSCIGDGSRRGQTDGRHFQGDVFSRSLLNPLWALGTATKLYISAAMPTRHYSSQ